MTDSTSVDQPRNHRRRHGKPTYALLLLVGLFHLVNYPAFAATLYIEANKGNTYNKIIALITNDLIVQLPRTKLSINLDNEKLPHRNTAQPDDLIIAIGTVAATRVASQNPNIPVLYTLIPSGHFNSLQTRPTDSAIFIDQPLERQITLIKTILPTKKTVGILLGPTNKEHQEKLTSIFRQRKLTTHFETISSRKDLLDKLQRTLTKADLLLSLPEPTVFNRYTAQQILLTTYRQRKPVIGFSHSYVRAGAIAGIYSTPEQIAKQTVEMAIRYFVKRSRLPAPQYPKYFSLSTNHQVARSLQITLPEDSIILNRLKRP